MHWQGEHDSALLAGPCAAPAARAGSVTHPGTQQSRQGRAGGAQSTEQGFPALQEQLPLPASLPQFPLGAHVFWVSPCAPLCSTAQAHPALALCCCPHSRWTHWNF